MKSINLAIIIVFCISMILTEGDTPHKIKLGIIGGGIGGTFTAYQILKSQKNFEVDMYDKASKEGGRLYTEVKDDIVLDMGGSYFLEGQEFIESLLKELKIETKPAEKRTSYGIFTKDKILIELGDSKLWNYLKMLWRYGFSSISSRKIVDIQHSHFKRLYKHLQSKNYFNSIGDFLKYMSCQELISQNLEEYLSPVLTQKYIDEIINSEVSSIYMQDAKSINAFTGMFALENFNKPYRSIENGSNQIVLKLLERLESNQNFKFFKDHKITEIHKEDNKLKIKTDNGVIQEYDIIIIATPLYNKNIIKFIGDFKFEDESKLYYSPISSEVAYIKGKVNNKYFNLNENDMLPESLISISTEESGIYNIDHVTKDIYKIRGSDILPQLQKIFVSYEIIKFKRWDFNSPNFRTYKDLNELPDLILDDHLFYMNSIESIADGIELSLISAHNIINMIENNMKKMIPKESKDEF